MEGEQHGRDGGDDEVLELQGVPVVVLVRLDDLRDEEAEVHECGEVEAGLREDAHDEVERDEQQQQPHHDGGRLQHRVGPLRVAPRVHQLQHPHRAGAGAGEHD